MVELRRGVKAGIVAGLVYGIFYAIIIPISFSLVASLLGFQTSPSLWGGYYVQLRVNPFALLIGGPILGLILGIIFAFTYKWLPGRSVRVKSYVFAVIVWLIVVLITITTQVSTGLFFSEIKDAQNLQIIMTGLSFLIFVLSFGELGWCWSKFGPKTS